MSKINIKGAIFDMDGTLLNSMSIWETVGVDYLLSRGIQPKENLRKVFKNMSIAQAAAYYQVNYGITDSAEQIIAGVNLMIEDFYQHDANAKKGVIEMLEILNQKGIKMCVATATDRYLVESTLQINGLLKYFDRIFTCSEVGYGKDTPEIYNKALEHIGTEKHNTYIFEDALYAIKTAKLAGYNVVGVYDEYEDENQKEIESISDIYINTFEEMRAYID